MYAELPLFFWTVLISEHSIIENIRPLSKVDQLWSKVHHNTTLGSCFERPVNPMCIAALDGWVQTPHCVAVVN